ncbi:hypothetical protein Tco_1175335 [Tanacetum coccineum]
MNTTKEQQKELDDALVAPENRLKIGKSNLRLSSNLKSKEPTLQVVLDALKLTPFYNAFEISADVPEIYMQEFWKFEEPTLEEDILSFIRDLGHTGEIKFLSNVNVNHMHQPWRSFAAIINKCLSGKTTALESLRLSRAQILWGMYHNKQVDYVYLLWEDLVFQVENKNSKKNSDMYYPRFTKVIVDYFMAKDQAIPRRNKMFWHYARDDFMFTTIRVISKHKDTQEYGAILPQHLTNQAMLESEAFKTYRAYATGEKAPKSKATKKKTDSESSPKTKPSQASKGKRIKTSAKGDKPATTKSKGLTVLSEVALSEAEQMKLATKRSLKEFHISHASGSGDGVDILSKVPDEQQQTGSGTNEGAGDKPEVPDVPEYRSESEEESWTFSQGEDEEEDEEHDSDDDNDDNDDEDDDQENDSQRTESDDEGDDFVHPNLSTYIADDQEKEKEEEKADDDDDDVTSDQKVSTPPDYELTEEDENQQDDDTMGGEQEDEEDEELYRDLNLNLDRRDTEMKMLKLIKRRKSYNHNKLREKKLKRENDKFLKQITDSNHIMPLSKDKVRAQVSPRSCQRLRNMDLFASYGDVVTLKRGRDDQDKDEEPFARSKLRDEERDQARKSPSKRSNSKGVQVYKFFQRKTVSYDLSKPLPLIENARGHQVIPFDHFINNDLEYLKGGSLSQKVTHLMPRRSMATGENIIGTKTSEIFLLDMLPTWKLQMMSTQDTKIIACYQFKIGSSSGFKFLEEITVRSQLLRKNDSPTLLTWISRHYLYKMDMDRENRLMSTDELYKFSDGILNHVRTVLNDISTRIQIEYLPKRKWSIQDKMRAWVLILCIVRTLRGQKVDAYIV